MYVTAIVLAAGKGLRFSRSDTFTVRSGIPRRYVGGKSNVSKPLANINSKPIIIHCLRALSRHPDIRDIIVVVNAQNSGGIVDKIMQYRVSKIRDIVLGGKRRQDSVRNGLEAVDSGADLVLIHDAARPFIDKDTLSLVIKEARRSGAAIAGVPVKETIKEVVSCQSFGKLRTLRRRTLKQVEALSVVSKFKVKKTLDRGRLWEVQTPQVFKKDLILKAYNRFGNSAVTDDASLVEKLGVRVRVVLGSYNNIKITTPEDLVLAEAISKNLIKKD